MERKSIFKNGLKTWLNNNIRCIETTKAREAATKYAELNNNIRCIETIQLNNPKSKKLVKQQHKMY